MTEQIEEIKIDEQPDAEAEQPAPTYTAEEADEARILGWKAPDEWVGAKPAGYIDDPKAYLDRLNNMKPFRAVREQQAKDKADFDERIRRIEAVNAASAKAQKEAYDRDLADIKRQQRAAVELADAEQYDALEARKAALQAPVAAPVQVPVAPDPYVAEYMEKQDWVKNPILRKAGAELIDAAGMNTRPVREQIEYAEREIRKMFPYYFPAESATARTMAQRVDGGGLGFASKGGEFAKLPAEAKAAFARFAEDGLFKNNDEGKKAYADQYNAA